MIKKICWGIVCEMGCCQNSLDKGTSDQTNQVQWQIIIKKLNYFLCVIDGLAGLVECKTKDKRTEVSRAKELTKEVNNWCLSYQTKVRGDSPLL